MCKYCEPDEAGNLASIEEDGDRLMTYLECYDGEWVLVTEMNTICNGTNCWGTHALRVGYCPMCGRELRGEVDE